MHNSLGIQRFWNDNTAKWHECLAASLPEEDGALSPVSTAAPLKSMVDRLEGEDFQALMRFSPELAASVEAFTALIHKTGTPGTMGELLEIEIHIDKVADVIENLAALQVSAFETLLFTSFILTAFLVFFYGYQGRQLAVAMEKKRRADEMKHRVTAIHETERKKLARDLHDGVSQNIALARMSLDRFPEGNAKVQLRLSLDKTFQELRNILYDLRSTEISETSLDDLIRREYNNFQDQYELTLKLDLQQDVFPRWKEDHLTQCIRILQEGLVNIIRHSGGKKGEVSLRCSAGKVILLIKDEGRGIKGGIPGMGITGMKERTALLGGTISWKSPGGKGTEIQLTIPEVLS